MELAVCLASGASCRVSLPPESSVHQLRAEAQRRLGRRGLRLAVAEAEEVTLSPGEMGIARTAQDRSSSALRGRRLRHRRPGRPAPRRAWGGRRASGEVDADRPRLPPRLWSWPGRRTLDRGRGRAKDRGSVRAPVQGIWRVHGRARGRARGWHLHDRGRVRFQEGDLGDVPFGRPWSISDDRARARRGKVFARRGGGLSFGGKNAHGPGAGAAPGVPAAVRGAGQPAAPRPRNPWHDLCSQCFCKYALRPALAAEALSPGLGKPAASVLGAGYEGTALRSDRRAEPRPSGVRGATGAERFLAAWSAMQVAVHLLTVAVNEGYESLWRNPLVGPSPWTLHRCGALFPAGGQHWRMASSLFVSAGLTQLVPGLVIQWTLLRLPVSFWRMLQVAVVSGLSGSLFSAASGSSSPQLFVGFFHPLHGLLTFALLRPNRFLWRLQAALLGLSLLLSALVSQLDFPGRLGSVLGALAVAAADASAGAGATSLRCAKALTLLVALTLWIVSAVDLANCACNTLATPELSTILA
ncbi:unnamed protein product [Effrenium voratum]|nr:unnamed protein product [Effrenium voratum]